MDANESTKAVAGKLAQQLQSQHNGPNGCQCLRFYFLENKNLFGLYAVLSSPVSSISCCIVQLAAQGRMNDNRKNQKI